MWPRRGSPAVEPREHIDLLLCLDLTARPVSHYFNESHNESPSRIYLDQFTKTTVNLSKVFGASTQSLVHFAANSDHECPLGQKETI